MRTQQKYHKEKNILEINPHAPIIQELNKIVEVFYFFNDRNNQMSTVLNLLRTCTTLLWFILDTLSRTHCTFHTTFSNWSTQLWVSSRQLKKLRSLKKISWPSNHQQNKNKFKNKLQKLTKLSTSTVNKQKLKNPPNSKLNKLPKTLSKLLPQKMKIQHLKNQIQRDYNCEILCIFLDLFRIVLFNCGQR